MNRINQLFKNKSSNILNIYFTAGHPTLYSIEKLVPILEKHGVDIVEIGMPYSDPMADGETIQNSSSVALKNGINLNLIFEQIATVRKTCNLPIVLMGYFNQLLQFGVEKFLQRANESGADGLIIPDLPIDEYQNNYKGLFEKYNLTISFLVTPQTSEERISLAAALSSAFLYVVSSSSITGGSVDYSNDKIEYFKKVNSLKNDTPSLIGFGISNKESFESACKYANGAIIGSAFIRALENKGNDITVASQDFINKIK